MMCSCLNSVADYKLVKYILKQRAVVYMIRQNNHQ